MPNDIPRYLSLEMVPAILAQADLVVDPSLSETFGWVMVEPLLSEVPVVTTRVGVAGELEAIGAVEAVDPKDWLAMADAIRRVIQDPIRARERACIGRKYVETHCSLRGVGQRLQHLYSSLFDDAPHEPVEFEARLTEGGTK